MVQKMFVFLDQSWWDSGPGCDCCPGSWVESWTCISHGELNWSYSSETDCITCAIQLFEKDFDEYDDMKVRQKSNSLGLSFSFIGG